MSKCSFLPFAFTPHFDRSNEVIFQKKSACGGAPLGKLLKRRAVSDGPLRGGLIAPKKHQTEHRTSFKVQIVLSKHTCILQYFLISSCSHPHLDVNRFQNYFPGTKVHKKPMIWLIYREISRKIPNFFEVFPGNFPGKYKILQFSREISREFRKMPSTFTLDYIRYFHSI